MDADEYHPDFEEQRKGPTVINRGRIYGGSIGQDFSQSGVVRQEVDENGVAKTVIAHDGSMVVINKGVIYGGDVGQRF